jgi:hypothetical protein
MMSFGDDPTGTGCHGRACVGRGPGAGIPRAQPLRATLEQGLTCSERQDTSHRPALHFASVGSRRRRLRPLEALSAP